MTKYNTYDLMISDGKHTVENITQSEVLGWEHVTTFLHQKGPRWHNAYLW